MTARFSIQSILVWTRSLIRYMVIAGIACHAIAEESSVTPYRPTVSNPAELSKAGWLELEAGWQYTEGGDYKHRNHFPYVLKYAFDEDWGILVGGDSYVSQLKKDAIFSNEGYGSIAALLKHRITWNENLHFGVEAGLGHHVMDGGVTDGILNGIYSHDIGPVRVDINLGLTRLGGSVPAQSPWIGAWQVAVGFPLNGDFGGAVEVSGYHQTGEPAFTQILGTLNYALHPRVVLDTGIALGTSQAAHDVAIFTGVAILLWRVN